MNKTLILVVSIISIAIVAIFYVWSSHNRYYIMTSSKGIAYEVDRKTGKSWALYGDRKILQEGTDTRDKPEKPLPLAERSKITGNASLSYGSFSGKIYNGSSWTITRIVINVTAKEEDGSVRWSRDLSDNVKISPLETGHFSVIVTGDHGIKKAPWTIKEIYGYQ
jgi:hypothetical protein